MIFLNAARGWIILLAAVIFMIWMHSLDELNVRIIAPWMDWLQHRMFMVLPGFAYMHLDKTWAVSGLIAFIVFMLASIATTIIWPWHTMSERAGRRLAKDARVRENREKRDNVAR